MPLEEKVKLKMGVSARTVLKVAQRENKPLVGIYIDEWF